MCFISLFFYAKSEYDPCYFCLKRPYYYHPPTKLGEGNSFMFPGTNGHTADVSQSSNFNDDNTFYSRDGWLIQMLIIGC